MIGDEQIPDNSNRTTIESDSVWSPSGSLLEWLKWVLAGKNDPSGRYTFSLEITGLIGPVSIIAAGSAPSCEPAKREGDGT